MKKFVATLLLGAICVLSSSASVTRVLFIGDSMTGWLSERLEAYGALNGFEVSTVIWDGSTLSKWVNADKIPGFITQYKPDVVFICLGLNELLVKNPGVRIAAPLDRLESQLGDIPFVWIGPPTWPGKGDGSAFNQWMEGHLKSRGFYFNSQGMQLARQSATNPHPTRAACAKWMDAVVEWLPSTGLGFPAQFKAPAATGMKRGSNYIYRRMKQTL